MAPALSTLRSSAMHWLFANSRTAAIPSTWVFIVSSAPAFGTAIGLALPTDGSPAHFSTWAAWTSCCVRRRVATAQSREVFIEAIGAQNHDKIAVVRAIGRERYIGKRAFGCD